VAEAVLEVDSLTKTFQGARNASVRAVDNVSFSVKQGEVVGLLGPNGAGKTTTIKCILGLVRQDSGSVRVFGGDLRHTYPGALRHMSAVLEGSRNLYWRLTVEENVRFFAGLNGLGLAERGSEFAQLLERFGLADKKNVEVRRLSQGMKQKTSVVCALARRTPIVFLDEPTLGLDVETSLELRDTLRSYSREEGRTVVVSSHDMDVVQQVCSRVIIMSNGRVVTDDSVAHLIDLFRTRTCTVKLGAQAGEGQQQSPQQQPPQAATSPAGGGPVEIPPELAAVLSEEFAPAEVSGSTVKVTLADSRSIYRLMDLLKAEQLPIEEIDYGAPDLEQVFLEIVRRAAAGANEGASGEATRP
jgi:ABC-2 type transport system ATP-binding protein